ncbi:hypothetical protein AVEN_99444-1 [Araneus ventricosus]|uniref:Gustatory receptor n=1 Tax=Araneus ventricosus TaxID=182803 RepID=A0A4Y2IZZ6_ARAVE|nr:hypothetical protein AVEN_99444-1 [Araneus ventricosus]
MEAWKIPLKMRNTKVIKFSTRMSAELNESSTELYNQSKIFIYALMICGIPVSRFRYILSLLCCFAFLACCTLTFLNTCACLVNLYSNFYVFTLATKIAALVSWWSMYRRKKNYKELLQFLSDLQKKTKCKNKSKLSRYSIICFLVFFFALCNPGGMWGIFSRSRLSYLQPPTCHEFWVRMTQLQYTSYHIFLQLARQFSNWGVPFSATLFYSFYCNELTSKIDAFQKILKERRSINSSAVINIYNITVKAITELEDSSSLAVLFVLFTNFAEAFRTFSLFFSTRDVNIYSSRVLLPGIYFLQTAFLFMLLIYSADTLQRHFRLLRKRVLETIDIKEAKSVHEGFRQSLKLIEDRERVRLTAWGMVEIKRTLVLTAVASLITYGVLLSQVSP